MCMCVLTQQRGVRTASGLWSRSFFFFLSFRSSSGVAVRSGGAFTLTVGTADEGCVTAGEVLVTVSMGTPLSFLRALLRSVQGGHSETKAEPHGVRRRISIVYCGRVLENVL